MKRQTICLNMIVKDEGHVIVECLESVYKFIDYYVIIDTGSTDDTQERIKVFFDAKKIKGMIIDHDFKTCKCHGNDYKKYPFFDFAHNRTYALNKCKGVADYVFFMDADDYIDGELKLPARLGADQYYMNVRTGGSLYFRPLLIKNDPKLRWKWIGALHECLVGSAKTTVQLKGQYAIMSRRIGARNKDPLKSVKELEFLELLIADNKGDAELIERYMYYYAQTLFEMKDYSKATDAYLALVPLTQNKQVQYSCRYMAARCNVLNQAPSHVIETMFVDCFIKHPNRAEPCYQLLIHFRDQNDYKKAYNYGVKGVNIPMPQHDVFYIDKEVYDYKLLDELVYCATALNKHQEALQLATQLLQSKKYPLGSEPIILENIRILSGLTANKEREEIEII